jgi:hypothetical protein
MTAAFAKALSDLRGNLQPLKTSCHTDGTPGMRKSRTIARDIFLKVIPDPAVSVITS